MYKTNSVFFFFIELLFIIQKQKIFNIKVKELRIINFFVNKCKSLILFFK